MAPRERRLDESAIVKGKFYSAHIITATLYFYWFLFWMLNGLDKIANRTDFGLFFWHGKDRTNQFNVYLERLDWPQDLYTLLMPILFVFEMSVALMFLLAIFVIFRAGRSDDAKLHLAVKLPILASMLCFAGFSIWDIIVGDRAELLEHATYIVVLCVTYIISHFEVVKTPQSVDRTGAR